MENKTTTDNSSLEDQWGAAFSEQMTAEAKQKTAEPKAKPANFAPMAPDPSPVSQSNLEMILDIPVTISVEIGRSRMVVSELIQLGQGSVVELDKLAGEPMEILVNGRLIARGEAVVINDKFGVKLTDIVSPTERINRLK